ncbi:unnamed protein product [Colias eurytheme]|nr:unnamed protein product [Colias eurytheme]
MTVVIMRAKESGADINSLSEVHSISVRTRSGSQVVIEGPRRGPGPRAARGGGRGERAAGGGGRARSRNIQSVRTPRDPHAATSLTYLTRNLCDTHPAKSHSIVTRVESQFTFPRFAVIAQNIRGQYFSSLGTAGIGPDTIDERARPFATYDDNS